MSLCHHRVPRQHIFVIFGDAARDPHPDHCYVSCPQNDDGNSDADVSDEVSVSASALGLGLGIISINSRAQKRNEGVYTSLISHDHWNVHEPRLKHDPQLQNPFHL